jgi:hypothetical protein
VRGVSDDCVGFAGFGFYEASISWRGTLLRFNVSFAAGPGLVGMAMKMRSRELYIGCVCAMYALRTCCTMYALRKFCAMFSIDEAVAGNCTALHA